MKKHYKIFWLSVLFAYLFFSYGAIKDTVNQDDFQIKKNVCQQTMPPYLVTGGGENPAPNGFISSCDPFILADWRDAGGLLLPYQKDILFTVDTYLQRYYWYRVALLIFVLGALPMLVVESNALWQRLQERMQKKGRRG